MPVGPVNTLDRVFQSEQVAAREMKITMAQPVAEGGSVSLIGNPLKLSKTPVSYRLTPPTFGRDSEDILSALDPGAPKPPGKSRDRP